MVAVLVCGILYGDNSCYQKYTFFKTDEVRKEKTQQAKNTKTKQKNFTKHMKPVVCEHGARPAVWLMLLVTLVEEN